MKETASHLENKHKVHFTAGFVFPPFLCSLSLSGFNLKTIPWRVKLEQLSFGLKNLEKQ